MEVCTGHAQLLDMIQAVDRTMTEFRLDTFYKVIVLYVLTQRQLIGVVSVTVCVYRGGGVIDK